MRLVTLALLMVIGVVQAELWFGKNSAPHVMALAAKLDAQRTVNEAARIRNERIAAEVSDLNTGLEMVEDKARGELGMVKPNEILVRVSAPR